MSRNPIVVTMVALTSVFIIGLARCGAYVAAQAARADAARTVIDHVLRRCGEQDSLERCRRTVGIRSQAAAESVHASLAMVEAELSEYRDLDVERTAYALKIFGLVTKPDGSYRAWVRRHVVEGSACTHYETGEGSLRVAFVVSQYGSGTWEVDDLDGTGPCS